MIQVEHLTKRYGDFTALNDLSFTLDEGGIYGFLGPNGAGKSTTMNIMTGCLSPTEGSVRIGGYDIFEDSKLAKPLIGYLPEHPPLYLQESPREYLRFVGQVKGLRGETLEKELEHAIARTQLEAVQNKRIRTLSKGYKQRVGIAQALLGDPKVIILDEPTVGLDPIQIIEIRSLIQQLGEDHTVLLSSHILPEVQALCGKIMIMSKGNLVAFDSPENLEKQMLASSRISFTAEADSNRVRSILSELPDRINPTFEESSVGTTRATFYTENKQTDTLARQLFFAFAKRNIALLELHQDRADLEDIFIELTEHPHDAPEADTAAPVCNETEGEDFL